MRAPSPPPPPSPSPSPPLGLLLSLCAGILLTCLVFSYLYISLWRGDHDGLNHAVGRDFINLWTASELVDAGRTADIFDQDKFAAAQRQHMGADFPFHFWSYPPQALILTEQLSSLPYRVAFLTWTLCGLLVLFYAAQKFWPAMKSFPWLLLLAPSTFVNVFLGQNVAPPVTGVAVDVIEAVGRPFLDSNGGHWIRPCSVRSPRLPSAPDTTPPGPRRHGSARPSAG